MTVRVAASIDLPADPYSAFAAVSDLASQEKWIIATRLYPIAGPNEVPQVGSRWVAFTGIAGLGFLDVMVTTEYDPPRRWVTQHEGDLVRGLGIFTVDAVTTGCRVTWAEELDLPFGFIGRLGWPLVRPIARLGLYLSLRRMVAKLARGSLPTSSAPEAVSVMPSEGV